MNGTGVGSGIPTVAEVGERALIRLLARFMAPPGGEVVVSLGDDCAVMERPREVVREVLTTDLLVEGTHFLRNAETDWYALGRKAVAANISDIASMGARPGALLVSLALPGDLPVACLERLYEGMAEETERWGGALVGGDTTRGTSLVINVAVTGYMASDRPPALRSNCRPGQQVYLSGAVGGSLAGLRLLLDASYAELRREPFADGLIRRHQMPEPRVQLGRVLADATPDLAMIDISDGLFNELHLLAEASGVGIEVDLDAVPLWPGVEELARASGTEKDDYRLFSGEEYELLFATALQEEALSRSVEGVEPAVTRIGRVTAGSGVVFLRAGKPVRPADRTFAHFTKPAPSE